MYNVAIIGAGQLGSRHLQGLKTANHELNIYIMDQSEQSLKVAEERYNQVDDNGYHKNVVFCHQISELPSQLEITIIATGSKPRAMLTKLLLEHSSVKYVVFEKVLFQKLSEYFEIKTLLDEKHVTAWVNCPRRMWNFYANMRKEFYGTTTHMALIGGDWGMGCNSIHFIDLYAYLTGNSLMRVDASGLNGKLYDSKRPGYKEILGLLCCNFTNNGTLLLDSSIVNLKEMITISNERVTYSISEGGRECWIRDENGERMEKFDIPYQSQMTGMLIDTILDSNNCQLPSYWESMQLHIPFIMKVLDYVNKISENQTDACPIT